MKSANDPSLEGNNVVNGHTFRTLQVKVGYFLFVCPSWRLLLDNKPAQVCLPSVVGNAFGCFGKSSSFFSSLICFAIFFLLTLNRLFSRFCLLPPLLPDLVFGFTLRGLRRRIFLFFLKDTPAALSSFVTNLILPDFFLPTTRTGANPIDCACSWRSLQNS